MLELVNKKSQMATGMSFSDNISSGLRPNFSARRSFNFQPNITLAGLCPVISCMDALYAMINSCNH